MEIDALWAGLEARLDPGPSGLVRQRIHPDSKADLLAVVSNPRCQRALWLQVPREAVGHLSVPKSARGVSMQLVLGKETATMELTLIDPAAIDVFTALAQDVARSAASAKDDEAAVRAFVGRFSRWMQLLQLAPQGLSGERQRGLFGELWFMREMLVPAVGPERATAAWQAPAGVPHDFQATGGAVEIKTSAANQPQVVRINGERQLDETGTPALFLVHFSLDVHRDSGETLPAMVEAMRLAVKGGEAQPVFEDRLLESGYADIHEPIYAHAAYTLRETNAFAVEAGFPRIVEADLAEGVGGVSYKLAIAGCAAFRVSEADPVTALGGGTDDA